MLIERQLYLKWRQFQCQKPATFWSEVFQYIYCIFIKQSVWVNVLTIKKIIQHKITFLNRIPGFKWLYRSVIFKIHFIWIYLASFPPYYVLLSYPLERSNYEFFQAVIVEIHLHCISILPTSFGSFQLTLLILLLYSYTKWPGFPQSYESQSWSCKNQIFIKIFNF